MPAWNVEMLGDGDRDIIDYAIRKAASARNVCRVTLEPEDGSPAAPSVDEYVISNYRFNGHTGRVLVSLCRWDDETNAPAVGLDGFNDVQHVDVNRISELAIY